MISVLILTYNEEANIADCIGSLPWRGDVHVLDSQSTDRTIAIAISLGARVTVKSFEGYATQRNAGLALPFKHEWIVMLDADERMTPELAIEIEKATASAAVGVAMFRVRRRDMFMGRWLRRSSGYPTWFPRVFRRGRAKVQREINETYLADGEVRQLIGHLNHFPFNNGIDWWFDRHNRYSAMEARLLLDGRRAPVAFPSATDPARRRAALKALAYRLPLRPYAAFLYLYVVRGGFLDGRPGWVYANMRLAYEIMINAKVAYRRYSEGADTGSSAKRPLRLEA